MAQLEARLATNDNRAKGFVGGFASRAVIHPWSAYVREATKRIRKGGMAALGTQMLGFGVRAGLLLLFPEEALIEEIGHVATTVLDSGAEFALEQGQEKIQEASKESENETREENDEDKFREQEEAVSRIITDGVGGVLDLVKNARQYESIGCKTRP